MHQHDSHEQVGYVAKGSFEITVGGEKKIAREGDCYYADRNVLHGVVALEEDSVLIDTFTPYQNRLSAALNDTAALARGGRSYIIPA